VCRLRRAPRPTLFPYTTLFRSVRARQVGDELAVLEDAGRVRQVDQLLRVQRDRDLRRRRVGADVVALAVLAERDRRDHRYVALRSEEHTSELQSRENLVCRLLL